MNTELPFDQYSRIETARLIVDNCIRPLVKSKSLRIIDLGGHKGHTKDFFTNDSITILDVYDESYDGYIKGDATNLAKIKDEEYDVVLSFDTLEHIPPKRRKAFIKEAIRISKHGFVLAAPFDNNNGHVRFAEDKANKLYKKINSKDHPWLKEHLEYGIPSAADIEEYFNNQSVGFTSFPMNNLSHWLSAQGLMFNATVLKSDIKEVVDVSRFYNKNLEHMESIPGQSYRKVYLASKLSTVIDSANKYGAKKRDEKVELDYINHINQAYAKILKRLSEDREYLINRETHLQNSYDAIATEVTSLRAENLRLTKELQDNFIGKTKRIVRRQIKRNK